MLSEESFLEFTNQINLWIEGAGIVIDVLGVVFIFGGIFLAIWRYVRHQRAYPDIDHYHHFKVWVGRALQLGLEILIAADIIKTVALEPTFQGLGVLGLLIVIRTFLGWTLILEIEDRWPWQPSVESVHKTYDE